jgi:ABC-type arginine/histidine transport system permease subunit
MLVLPYSGATIVSGGVAERVKSPTYAAYAFFMILGYIYIYMDCLIGIVRVVCTEDSIKH